MYRLCVLLFTLVYCLDVEASGVHTSSQGVDSWYRNYTARSNCLLKNSTLERFKYVTFYSWHTYDGSWAQMGQESVIEPLVQWYNQTGGRSSMLEAQGIFFEGIPPHSGKGPNGHEKRGLQLRSDWKEQWEAVCEELDKQNLVERGIITGFMLGDELCWNNITWEELNMTSSIIKAKYPTSYIMYTEGGAVLYANRNMNGYKIHYPHVPTAIDFFSSDDYGTMYQFKNPQWFYNSFVWRYMTLPHQTAWVIPPSFQPACRSWLGTSNYTVEQCDEATLNQTYAYLDWIDMDPCITGSDAFYYDIDGGLLTLNKTTECWKELSAQVIAYQKENNISLSPKKATTESINQQEGRSSSLKSNPKRQCWA